MTEQQGYTQEVPGILVRSFEVDLEVGDGRTVVGRAVPYGIPTDVADRPGGPVYREAFEPGAFRRAVKAHGAGRAQELRYEHGKGLLDIVGPAQVLEERDDGLWGEWRALDGPVGDQALGLIRAGILRGLSIGFRPLGPGRREDGVVWRTSCHLDETSLTRTPAYLGAEVTAVRTRLAELAELKGPPRDEALDKRLQQLGLLS